MRSIRFLCWLALPVGLAIGSINAANAQSNDVVQACTPDAQRLCSEFIPDRDKVKTCMLRKRRQLSVACRTAMSGGARERRPYYHRGRRVRHEVRRRQRHRD